MTITNVWPSEGDELTVLVSAVSGRALTMRGKAGRVDAQSLLIPRTSLTVSQIDVILANQESVTVAYQKSGKLIFWRMRVEEVLPSSLFLVSVRPPSLEERRSFVRAHLRLWVSLVCEDGHKAIDSQQTEIDISASGFGLLTPTAFELGAVVDAEIGATPSGPKLRASGVVVRREVRGLQYRTAVRFVTLGSADEERLLELVYLSRQNALAERLGRHREA